MLNNLIFMYKIKAETAPPVFVPKFQKLAHLYLTNFSNLNYINPTSQLSTSKDRISVRGPALWNNFLTNIEKEIENLLLFKSKVKTKLLSDEKEVSFSNDFYARFHINLYQ